MILTILTTFTTISTSLHLPDYQDPFTSDHDFPPPDDLRMGCIGTDGNCDENEEENPLKELKKEFQEVSFHLNHRITFIKESQVAITDRVSKFQVSFQLDFPGFFFLFKISMNSRKIYSKL